MEETNNIHYIPKDAVIPIEIGSGYLQRLQKGLLFMMENKTPEEIEELKLQLSNNTIVDDTWMYHYQTLISLVMAIEQAAVDKKITILKPLEYPESFIEPGD